MAIGWGKSFEDQIEEANQRASKDRHAPKSKGVLRKEQALESLRLSRARIEEQLEKAVHPAHRAMLMKALQAVEKEAEELSQHTRES
ncbi:MAG TPA: hypothetical protein DHU55_08830 [Blastocatellia bacterium]|jgi:hypothetical protein|nr:hypothetical protein [Blastocatellia bacterium]HAF25317.1 hypothetical protein [Blastocatellia bacterium]HCX29854.1 hypothetical protein [Blastocatellia bacterium]